MSMVDWAIARLKEPSTAVSISVLLTMLHVTVDPGLINNIITVLAIIMAVAGVVLKEKGQPITKVFEDAVSVVKTTVETSDTTNSTSVSTKQ